MKIKIEYKLTLDELAKEIWNLDDHNQAELLSKLYNIEQDCYIQSQLEGLSKRLKEKNNKSGFNLICDLYDKLESD